MSICPVFCVNINNYILTFRVPVKLVAEISQGLPLQNIQGIFTPSFVWSTFTVTELNSAELNNRAGKSYACWNDG